MALGSKIVDLVRLYRTNDMGKPRRIRHVPMVQNQPLASPVCVPDQVIDPLRIGAAEASPDAVYLVPLRKKQFGKIRPVLAGNTRDKGFFRCRHTLFFGYWKVKAGGDPLIMEHFGRLYRGPERAACQC